MGTEELPLGRTASGKERTMRSCTAISLVASRLMTERKCLCV